MVYDDGKTLVWKTVWNSPQAAEAAMNAMGDMCLARFDPGGSIEQQGPNLLLPNRPGCSVAIHNYPANEVVMIVAQDPKSNDLLGQQFGE